MASIKDLRRNKGGIWIIIVAALVLETTALLQYYYTKHIIRIASEQIVQSELRNINLSVIELADTTTTAQIDYIVEQMKRYPNCSYTLTDANGMPLLPEPDTITGGKYHTFREQMGASGWTISVLIPDSDLYGNLRRLGGLVTILMIGGLALLVFIIYRSAKNILNLINVEESKQRIEGEIEIAQAIQSAMLPKVFPPFADRPDLNIYGVVQPAKEIGGDLYDFYVRHDKLFFCVGDVSGKGVPASLVMATIRSLFRSTTAHYEHPGDIARQMNDTLAEQNTQNMFVTLFIGVLDLNTGMLDYCNAGHNAPIYLQSGHINHNQSFLPVTANLPIGIISRFDYQEQQIQLHYGDVLFLYTDGLTEAEDKNHTQYGEQRMIDSLDTTGGMRAQEIVQCLLDSVTNFVGNAPQSDDLTMLAIRFQIPAIVMRNDIQQIPTLAQWIDQLHIPNELNMPINLALEEVVSNVMLYAYPSRNDGKVFVEFVEDSDMQNKRLIFTVSDSGIPFDPTQKIEANITLSAEEREIGGLGIHLVRQLMDEIHYQRTDERNILTLIKYL